MKKYLDKKLSISETHEEVGKFYKNTILFLMEEDDFLDYIRKQIKENILWFFEIAKDVFESNYVEGRISIKKQIPYLEKALYANAHYVMIFSYIFSDTELKRDYYRKAIYSYCSNEDLISLVIERPKAVYMNLLLRLKFSKDELKEIIKSDVFKDTKEVYLLTTIDIVNQQAIKALFKNQDAFDLEILDLLMTNVYKNDSMMQEFCIKTLAHSKKTKSLYKKVLQKQLYPDTVLKVELE